MYQSVAGHGVTGERHFPARLVSEAAGEGVLTVAHCARLELRHKQTNKQHDEYLFKRKARNIDGRHARTAADLLQVVLLQQRSDEGLGPLFGRLGVIGQKSVRDEAEKQNRGR